MNPASSSNSLWIVSHFIGLLSPVRRHIFVIHYFPFLYICYSPLRNVPLNSLLSSLKPKINPLWLLPFLPCWKSSSISPCKPFCQTTIWLFSRSAPGGLKLMLKEYLYKNGETRLVALTILNAFDRICHTGLITNLSSFNYYISVLPIYGNISVLPIYRNIFLLPLFFVMNALLICLSFWF